MLDSPLLYGALTIVGVMAAFVLGSLFNKNLAAVLALLWVPVGVVGLALTTTSGTDDIVADIAERYDVTVDEHPGDLSTLGPWRIDGDWHQCFVEDGPEPMLHCTGVLREFKSPQEAARG